MIILNAFSSVDKVCYDHNHPSSFVLTAWTLQTYAQGCPPATNETHHVMHCPDCMLMVAEAWVALLAGETGTAHTIPQPDLSFLPSIGAASDE